MGELAPDDSCLVRVAGNEVGRLSLPMAGKHNRANALAAVAAARHAGIPPIQALAALARFGGVKRRLEVRGEARGVIVYDDFAHHPTAIAATIAGLRQRIDGGRILAVLEPRSNTMKLGVMKAQLPASLEGADLTFCYAANLGWDANAALLPLGDKARVYEDIEALVGAVSGAARDGDHVLVMSNGSFCGVHTRLLQALTS